MGLGLRLLSSSHPLKRGLEMQGILYCTQKYCANSNPPHRPCSKKRHIPGLRMSDTSISKRRSCSLVHCTIHTPTYNKQAKVMLMPFKSPITIGHCTIHAPTYNNTLPVASHHILYTASKPEYSSRILLQPQRLYMMNGSRILEEILLSRLHV
jgi:hypothetical protein